jgi:hypothetical protein
MQGTLVHIPAPDGTADAYLAHPGGTSPVPSC